MSLYKVSIIINRHIVVENYSPEFETASNGTDPEYKMARVEEHVRKTRPTKSTDPNSNLLSIADLVDGVLEVPSVV
jgi:hypothetical protein